VSLMAKRKKLRILVTAGPTREKLDPVRFISNYSTGTFGYAIASQARRRGHKVTLVSGPVALKKPKGVEFVGVESALDMMRAVLKKAKRADCIIMAAAVSDWRPRQAQKAKIKKGPASLSLKLVKNPDIIKELGRQKGGKILAGFALETEDLLKNAKKKLKEKNLDLIIANRLGPSSNVFGNKTAKITLIDRFGARNNVPAGSKARMAKIILDKVLACNI
jgi:phosphopantothenoylcysteine decarboxylase / phosphopantothenate---cysteine ligase